MYWVYCWVASLLLLNTGRFLVILFATTGILIDIVIGHVIYPALPLMRRCRWVTSPPTVSSERRTIVGSTREDEFRQRMGIGKITNGGRVAATSPSVNAASKRKMTTELVPSMMCREKRLHEVFFINSLFSVERYRTP